MFPKTGVECLAWSPCINILRPRANHRISEAITGAPLEFGMLIGSMGSPFCIPLSLGIHQGLVHVNEKGKAEKDKETLGTRIIQMALDFAIRHDLPYILVLDAFFPTAAVFRLADSVCSINRRSSMVTLIVRAKKNFVAYFEAEKPTTKKRETSDIET